MLRLTGLGLLLQRLAVRAGCVFGAWRSAGDAHTGSATCVCCWWQECGGVCLLPRLACECAAGSRVGGSCWDGVVLLAECSKEWRLLPSDKRLRSCMIIESTCAHAT